MYQRIKQLADDAIALQNKNSMDAALREISGMCDPSGMTADQFEAAELAQHRHRNDPPRRNSEAQIKAIDARLDDEIGPIDEPSPVLQDLADGKGGKVAVLRVKQMADKPKRGHK